MQYILYTISYDSGKPNSEVVSFYAVQIIDLILAPPNMSRNIRMHICKKELFGIPLICIKAFLT